MGVLELKRYGIMFTMVCATGVLLSLIWRMPHLYTVIGFAVWAFVGHLITFDDDAPGGWNNPDGSIPFPWTELAIKAAVLLGLLGTLFLMPTLRAFGG